MSMGQRKKVLSPNEESNHRPSDSALQCSPTEPQRLYGEQSPLRSSYIYVYIYMYDRRPAYCHSTVNSLNTLGE